MRMLYFEAGRFSLVHQQISSLFYQPLIALCTYLLQGNIQEWTVRLGCDKWGCFTLRHRQTWFIALPYSFFFFFILIGCCGDYFYYHTSDSSLFIMDFDTGTHYSCIYPKTRNSKLVKMITIRLYLE